MNLPHGGNGGATLHLSPPTAAATLQQYANNQQTSPLQRLVSQQTQSYASHIQHQIHQQRPVSFRPRAYEFHGN